MKIKFELDVNPNDFSDIVNSQKTISLSEIFADKKFEVKRWAVDNGIRVECGIKTHTPATGECELYLINGNPVT